MSLESKDNISPAIAAYERRIHQVNLKIDAIIVDIKDEKSLKKEVSARRRIRAIYELEVAQKQLKEALHALSGLKPASEPPPTRIVENELF